CEPAAPAIVVKSDRDGDLWPDSEDCAPDDPTIHPSVEEVCDRLDNNCDGQIDEGFDRPWMLDADDDGFGGLDGRVVRRAIFGVWPQVTVTVRFYHDGGSSRFTIQIEPATPVH
ncbi:MAG: putative metal-binding motif-containing protein, partial [Myxococcota bacterium]